jgi:hypothetical protein
VLTSKEVNMANQPSTPFYGGSTQSGGAPPPGGSQQRLALDNLLRRELKVGDPNDPAQIADALMTRYQEDPRARAIAQEALGLPFLLPVQRQAPTGLAPTSSTAEWQQAVSDVERDLQELTTNALLKDVTPELQGWAQAIRSAIAEGVNAARFGLDSRQRDKAFAIRRQLGDYARMARLVGALTPSVNRNYRSFAQSLDEVSAVLLVMMGEALANVGFAGGHYLLQSPYSELQVRRDAVIYALRNLVGATQEAYGPSDWPRGLDAYRRLYDTLDDQGQGDLRALLVETEVARIMDELIQRAGQGTADGLRALGSTAQLDLEPFRRMVANGGSNPQSPPLTTYLEALHLFADAFEPSGGFRLLWIARPPILFYGLYGAGSPAKADGRLTQLLIQRGVLAGQLDCLMSCSCDDRIAILQIVLDMILYEVDRAIDLYAVGLEDLGSPENRASAFSYVIDAVLPMVQPSSPPHPIRGTLTTIQALLRPMNDDRLTWDTTATAFDIASPSTEARRRELDIQRDTELRWQNLVRAMAPNCIEIGSVLGGTGIIAELIDKAINLVLRTPGAKVAFRRFEPDIPRHFETSLNVLVDDAEVSKRGS